MVTSIRPASETAAMIIENVSLYSQEKAHEHTLPRFKMSDTAIRRISGHVRFLPESYIEQLTFELRQLDWLMARYDSGMFIFMGYAVAKNWTTLTAKRVVPNDDLTLEYDTWTLPELQGFAQRNDFLQPGEEGFHNRDALIRAIIKGEAH